MRSLTNLEVRTWHRSPTYLRHYLRSGQAPSGIREQGSEEVAKVFDEWRSPRPQPPPAIERGVDLD